MNSGGQLAFDLTDVTPGPWERGFLVVVTDHTHTTWKEMGNETLKNLSLEIAPDSLLALSQVGLGLLEHSLNLSSSGDVLWWVTLCYFSNWIGCELFAKGGGIWVWEMRSVVSFW